MTAQTMPATGNAIETLERTLQTESTISIAQEIEEQSDAMLAEIENVHYFDEWLLASDDVHMRAFGGYLRLLMDRLAERTHKINEYNMVVMRRIVREGV